MACVDATSMVDCNGHWEVWVAAARDRYHFFDGDSVAAFLAVVCEAFHLDSDNSWRVGNLEFFRG